MKLYTDKVVKIYRKRTVVKQVSVEVNQGEIVGRLGPNGAGKTTTFYMVVGIIRPNSGNVYMASTSEGLVPPQECPCRYKKQPVRIALSSASS